eukprot:UN27767
MKLDDKRQEILKILEIAFDHQAIPAQETLIFTFLCARCEDTLDTNAKCDVTTKMYCDKCYQEETFACKGDKCNRFITKSLMKKHWEYCDSPRRKGGTAQFCGVWCLDCWKGRHCSECDVHFCETCCGMHAVELFECSTEKCENEVCTWCLDDWDKCQVCRKYYCEDCNEKFDEHFCDKCYEPSEKACQK